LPIGTILQRAPSGTSIDPGAKRMVIEQVARVRLSGKSMEITIALIVPSDDGLRASR